MAQPSILSPGTKVGGKYEVVEVIGFGGMGLVYKVREQVGAVSRTRALKTVLPQYASDAGVMARFRQEAEKMCLLEHENIVPVLSYSEEGEFPYLVMPFIEGQTLKDYLASHVAKEGRGLPLAEVMEIGLEIARGLEIAHGFVSPETRRASPMVHRDIKPGNIMIRVEQTGAERRVKVLIMDFGIAKVISGEDTGHTLTEVIGTVKYAAPEQVRRGKDIDPRADVYSLGMVLFELYAGKHMFAGLAEHSVLMRMMQRDLHDHEIAFPEEAPERFRQLIRRCVAVDRDRRMGSVAEMRALMRRILEEDSERIHTEIENARRAASDERAQALAVDADRFSPDALAEADRLLADGEAAAGGGELRKALSALRAAAERFTLARVDASHGRERERLASGLSTLSDRRTAAVEAHVDQLAPTEFARADQATGAVATALQDDDLSRGARALSDAERAWIEAEGHAEAERRRLEATRACEAFDGVLAREREEAAKLPRRLRDPRFASELEALAAASREAHALAAAGDGPAVARLTTDGLARLERLAGARTTALAGAVRDLDAELDRRLAELAASPDRELVANEHAELAAAAAAARARDDRIVAVGELEQAVAAAERIEARRAERAAERDRRLAAEERNRDAAPAAARALAALVEARSRLAAGPSPNAAEQREIREIETTASAAEERHRAGEPADALPRLQAAAERLAALAEAISARDERERLAAELAGLRSRAAARRAELEGLGGEASEVGRRLLEGLAAAERHAGRGEAAAAIDVLTSTLPEIERHVAEVKAARELARREAEARVRGESASAARARAIAGWRRDTSDAAFAAADADLARGRAACEKRDFAAAGAAFDSAARRFEEIVAASERAEREARRQLLEARREGARRAVEALPAARSLARRRKAAVRALEEAGRAIAGGEESEAARLLDQVERASVELAEEAARRAAEPPRPTPWRVIGAAAGAVVALAVLSVLTLSRGRQPSTPLAKATPAPALPTAVPRVETPVAIPPPVATEMPRRPTAVPAPPTALPTVPAPPTAVPPATVVPTLAPPEPTAAPPPPLALASAKPSSSSIRLAAGADAQFEAALKDAAGASLEWRVGGKTAGKGRSFALGRAYTENPATLAVEVVAVRGAERAALRSWEVVVEPPPLGFARLEPTAGTVERTPGTTVGFRAAVRNAEEDKLAFAWQVNGDEAPAARGSSYEFRADRPGDYVVQVTATAPWGASITNRWRLLVKPPPTPSITEEIKRPPAAADLRVEAQEWITAYCGAFQRKDTNALIALGHLSGPSEAARLKDALATMQDLKVDCSNPSVKVNGDQAVVSFDRTDRWVDPRGTAMEYALPRITKTLHRSNGRWVAAQ